MKKCCSCNKLESDYESSCSVCGSPLIPLPGEPKKTKILVDKEIPVKKETPVKKEIPVKKVPMVKKCANCDHIEQPGKTQCSRCGGYLLSVPQNSNSANEASSMRQTCPQCGSVNHGGRQKCIYCGVELEIPEKESGNENGGSLGGGHAIALLVMFLFTAFSALVAYCFIVCSPESGMEVPSFYPFSIIAPAIDDLYFVLHILEIPGWFSLLSLVSIVCCFASLIFFFGLIGKKRWAGEYVGWVFPTLATMLVVSDLLKVALVSDGEAFFDDDSGAMWLISAVIVLIGWGVQAYYQHRLEDMNDYESSDEEAE